MGKSRDAKVAILPSTTRKGTTLSTSAALDSPSVISQLVSPPQASHAGTSAESENSCYNFNDASTVLDDNGSLGSFLDATIARSRQIENTKTPNEKVNSPESVEHSSDDLDEDYVELDDDFIDKCNATTGASNIKKLLAQHAVRYKLSPDPKFATSPINIKDKDYDFSLDLSHISIVEKTPFCGTEKESAVEHMNELSTLSSLFSDDIKKRNYFVAKNFPFSLKDDAKTWYNSLPPDSIDSPNGLLDVFFRKYFPASAQHIALKKIYSFDQEDGEKLPEAWARFCSLIRARPGHDLEKHDLLDIFYSGLTIESRAYLDSCAGCVFRKRTPDDAEELMARISQNHDDWTTPEPTPTPILKKRGMIKLNDEDMREGKKSLKEKGIKSEDVKNLPPIEDLCKITPPSSTIEVHSLQRFDKEDIPYSKPPDQCLDEFDNYVVKQDNFNMRVENHLMENSQAISKLHDIVERTSNDVKMLVKHFHMVQTQIDQLTKVQNDLLRNTSKEKHAYEVTTRGGVSTQDPLYPEGHPKRVKQDSQRTKETSAPSKKKKKKHKTVVESSEPVNDPNSISISDAETESGNEHDKDNDKNDASDKEEVEDEPEKHAKNKKYTKEDFIAKKHGSKEAGRPRYTDYPIGICEDVPVQVTNNCLILTDFVVLEMPEDDNMSIILGRPFLNTAGAVIDCNKGKVTFNVDDKEHTIYFPKRIDKQHLEDSESEIFRKERDELEEIFLRQPILKHDLPVEDLGTTPPPKEDPVFDLKPLPDNLKYAHIDDKKIYPVIISSKLSEIEEERLLEILKKHRGAIGYTLDDLKGISPSICQHAINMEDDAKPVVEHQRRLIPKMKEVVRNEVLRLLEAGIIYPIADSRWVSPVHCVPKKGGMTVVPNDNDELIPQRVVVGLENIAYDPVPVNDSFPNEQLAVIKVSSRDSPCTMVSKNKGKEFPDEDDRDLGWKEEVKDVKEEDEEEVEEDSRASPRATIASIKVMDNPFSANKSARIRTGGAVPRHYLAPRTSPSGTHHPFHNLIFNNQIEGTPKAALPSQWDIDRSNTAGEKEPEAEEWGNNSKSWDSPSDRLFNRVEHNSEMIRNLIHRIDELQELIEKLGKLVVTEDELDAYIERSGHHAGDGMEEAEEPLDLSSDAASSSNQHFGHVEPSSFSAAQGSYYDHAMYDPPAWNPDPRWG
ncbi:hypothetical protein QYE76_059798 [Lolium multiflorum]|uniref:Retrotransposon gag domain-containing protein n=1 Tax=Lolium multiflorum TaxID=4521 RepID=A0AAD8RZ84_LOLMU|nr:hypothetical protein QYE76_059798 [Lolium multiflorum]